MVSGLSQLFMGQFGGGVCVCVCVCVCVYVCVCSEASELFWSRNPTTMSGQNFITAQDIYRSLGVDLLRQLFLF